MPVAQELHGEYESHLKDALTEFLLSLSTGSKEKSKEGLVPEVTLVRDCGGCMPDIRKRAELLQQLTELTHLKGEQDAEGTNRIADLVLRATPSMLSDASDVVRRFAAADAKKLRAGIRALEEKHINLRGEDKTIGELVAQHDELPVIRAYVILKSKNCQRALLRAHHGELGKNFEGCVVRFSPAPEPTNILWANQEPPPRIATTPPGGFEGT